MGTKRLHNAKKRYRLSITEYELFQDYRRENNNKKRRRKRRAEIWRNPK